MHMSHALLYSWFQSPLETLRRRQAPPHYDFCLRGRIAYIAGRASGSRMALHIFADCCFRQGIEAQSVALAVEPYRREFLLTKHGDDPMQRNTARSEEHTSELQSQSNLV